MTLTIIIPIYNTESFIEKCLLSVCNQTLEKFNIILVNDCSPDRAMDKAISIINLFPNRKKYTTFINLPRNLGLAGARKAAFDEITTTYFTCLDSDDYLELDALKAMLDAAIKYEADIVVCDYFITFKNKEKVVIQHTTAQTYINDILYNYLHASYCNKLYRTNLLKNISIIENINMCEDLLAAIQIGFYTKNIFYINKPFLHYVQYNSSSYTNTYSTKSINDIIFVLEFIDSYIKKNTIVNNYSLYDNSLYYRKQMMNDLILEKTNPIDYHKYYNLYKTSIIKNFNLKLSIYQQLILIAGLIRSKYVIFILIYLKKYFLSIKGFC